MCLRCYRGLFRYTRGNAELSVPAHVFGLRFVRCHSLHVCIDMNLVQNDDDAHEGGSDDDDDDDAVENAVGDNC